MSRAFGHPFHSPKDLFVVFVLDHHTLQALRFDIAVKPLNDFAEQDFLDEPFPSLSKVGVETQPNNRDLARSYSAAHILLLDTVTRGRY
jgi:hypothetical protein